MNLQPNILCSEEQGNLRIVEHLDTQSLPEPLRLMLTLASTPEEQDILLLATLTAASACVPNLYFRYGPTGKRYYSNLQCFILAASASGKGIANQVLEMVRVIDERYPLLISGDSTLAAWYKALMERNGCGYMHESEGSVITDIWKSGAANYNTALRKAAEHEPISRNRCTGASEIGSPRLSMLLTGTFNQYRTLVPSIENGYFSRLLTLVIREQNPFNKHYVTTTGNKSAVAKQVGLELLNIYEHLTQNGEQEWSLSDEQKERLGSHLETEYNTLIHLLGENFHSVVLRMAVHIIRIAMILSAMRGKGNEAWICRDEDYQTAELIGNKLLLHMAATFRMIEGDKQDLVPEIKPLDPKKILFEQLNTKYSHRDLAEEAQRQGISKRTAERWNMIWMEKGLVQKTNFGEYKKIG
ncbi:MAG: DUF3987 domain-containing protein [Paludibacteraceae bacterium]|nr:DUF3987 domain-containing protein [Paludibacteraceae bacterium]